MITQFARTLTYPVRVRLRHLSRKYGLDPRFRQRETELRNQLEACPRRLVIGASGVFEPGWIGTDRGEFDLLRPDSWSRYVQPDSIDALLAEHVWEHLTPKQ